MQKQSPNQLKGANNRSVNDDLRQWVIEKSIDSEDKTDDEVQQINKLITDEIDDNDNKKNLEEGSTQQVDVGTQDYSQYFVN